MDETRATDVRFPPGRYGRRREGSRRKFRWLAVASLIVVVVAGTAIAVQMYRQYGEGEFRHEVMGFDTAERSVDVTFEVYKPEGVAGKCLVRARSANGAEVGHAEASIPPQRSDVRVDYTLRTSGKPVTGEVLRCYPAT